MWSIRRSPDHGRAYRSFGRVHRDNFRRLSPWAPVPDYENKIAVPMSRVRKRLHWQMVVVANDFQVPFHDSKCLALLNLFLENEQPDWLILNGDFHDFWEISNFDLAPRGGKRFLKEIEIGSEILAEFRRILPKVRITWIEGNHEFRLRKYLMRDARELYGLKALTVQKLFGLQKLKIGYVPCHRSASRFTDNFIRVGDLYVGHWHTVARQGGRAARLLAEAKGVSVLQGHTHRFGARARTAVDGCVLLGIENFSMCPRRSRYVSCPNWRQGFSLIYLQRTTESTLW
jgi:predicted phosphodiesterase